MTQQGWQPGEYLGAKNAPHAEFHTAANASHIRVFLKDDNLGLGAKLGSGVGPGECTGLDAFQNLLGRLNGKDEAEIEQEQKTRDDAKMALYTERKWGSIRFVKGGLLVGDKIQDLIDDEAARVKKLEEEEKYTVPIKSEDDSTIEGAGESKKKNKRKVKEEGEEGAELVAVKTKKSKRKRRSEAGLDGLEEVQAALQEIDDGPKIKKEEDEDSQMKDVTSEEAPKKQKKDKKDKKEKRDKKDKKAKKVKEESSASEEEISKEERRRLKKEKRKAKLDASASASESTTKESTPAVPVTSNSSGTSTPVLGRHLVRSRYIAQKKMASMDATALNQVRSPSRLFTFRFSLTNPFQIFMIKSQS